MNTVDDGLIGSLEERIDELNKEILEKDQIIIHLQAEKRELRRWGEKIYEKLYENKEFEKKYDSNEMENEMKRMKDELITIQNTYKQQKDEISKLYRQVYEYQDENNELLNEIQCLRNELVDLKCQIPLTTNIPDVKNIEKKIYQWEEHTIRYPTPQFQMDSNEIYYLLCQWTQNPSKIQSLMGWLTVMSQDIPDTTNLLHATTPCIPPNTPLAIELPRLTNEIRDGFLTLVVPLLRNQVCRHIYVHTRSYDADHTDLRIRVAPNDHVL